MTTDIRERVAEVLENRLYRYYISDAVLDSIAGDMLEAFPQLAEEAPREGIAAKAKMVERLAEAVGRGVLVSPAGWNQEPINIYAAVEVLLDEFNITPKGEK